MTVKENLIAAKALIDTPEKWIKGRHHSEDMKCHCAIGALVMVKAGSDIDEERFALLSQMPTPRAFISTFNDDPDTTHADIMVLFDRAIAAADASP